MPITLEQGTVRLKELKVADKNLHYTYDRERYPLGKVYTVSAEISLGDPNDDRKAQIKDLDIPPKLMLEILHIIEAAVLEQTSVALGQARQAFAERQALSRAQEVEALPSASPEEGPTPEQPPSDDEIPY